MKLLILTAWYHPFIHPRAHRWTALAEHWAAQGHEVQVLTAQVDGTPLHSMLQGVEVHRTGFDSLKEWLYFTLRIKNGRGRVGVAPRKSKWHTRLLEWCYKVFWKNLFFPDDACIWYFPARRKMLQLLEKEHFDAIISVSLPFTDHLLGLVAKKKYPRLFWLADIGDPFSIQAKTPNNPWLYKKLNLQLERKVLENADAVVVTTPAAIEAYEKLFGADIAGRLVVIPPLFSAPAPCKIEAPLPQGINMGYFGALYAPTRTPDALLSLLVKIYTQRPELKSQLTVHFYGEVFPEFYEQLKGRCMGNILVHGLRSREESWAAMQSMDILINIGNTTDFQLPSKAVDYLAVGKPILNLSYVENDPFAQFFEGDGLVFNLLVCGGVISDDQVLSFLAWVETEKPVLDPSALVRKVRQFLVDSTAKRYLALLVHHFYKSFVG
jgi:Glycosyltransferase Family 4